MSDTLKAGLIKGGMWLVGFVLFIGGIGSAMSGQTGTGIVLVLIGLGLMAGAKFG